MYAGDGFDVPPLGGLQTFLREFPRLDMAEFCFVCSLKT